MFTVRGGREGGREGGPVRAGQAGSLSGGDSHLGGFTPPSNARGDGGGKPKGKFFGFEHNEVNRDAG